MFSNSDLLPAHQTGREVAVVSPSDTMYASSNTDSFHEGNPLIPTKVYDGLPKFLKGACRVFDDPYERDVFLTSALGVLSACFDNVYGYYDRSYVKANLFVFVIAPAASGKGSMVWARQLAQQLHERIKATTPQLSGSDKSTFPKTLFTPANSSAAAITAHLVQNQGLGLICETEADTMAATLKQDWANYSDLYRRAFHHEVVSVSRKVGYEYTELQNPRLSIVMTGTPGQVKGIIPSTEDGLFSRFMFYSFRTEPNWRNVSPKAQLVSYEKFFSALSGVIADYSESIQETSVQFLLRENQWDMLNQTFTERLENSVTSEGEDTASIVKRLGLISFRIAMLFTIIRCLDEDALCSKVECIDKDFENALALTEVYYQHSIFVYKSLPRKDIPGLSVSKRKFYDALPSGRDFSLTDAIVIGDSLTFSSSAVSKYLASFLKAGMLTQPKYGWYRKN